nr:10128_t:CDS:2 [Entrophospora candida]
MQTSSSTTSQNATNSSLIDIGVNIFLGICRFPFLIISKIFQKLLSPVKRTTQRRTQNHSPTLAFRIIWMIALLLGEILIFSFSMKKCSWPEATEWDTSIATPFHVALIADPQIIDDYSYGRTGILQKISEIYPDMYMRKNWINLQTIFDPDAIIFMGDLMDGGRELDDNKWESELHRFQHLFFPRKPTKTPIYYMAGNHDIGFGDKIVDEAYNRFRKFFGRVNYMVNLGNHLIAVIDTIALSGSNEASKQEAMSLIETIAEGNSSNLNLPKILLTHVPLYRPRDTDCGPLRQKNNYINQGRGYQYQNLVRKNITDLLLDKIKPSVVFSGDDHDYCEIKHEEAGEITEVSINSFRFLLLSLYNPPKADNTSSSSPIIDNSTVNITYNNSYINNNTTPTFLYSQCLLPNQLRIYYWYLVLLIVTILCIFSHTFVKIRRNNEILPVWQRYQQPKGKWIMFSSQYWKLASKELGNIALFALSTYLICWIWFLI